YGFSVIPAGTMAVGHRNNHADAATPLGRKAMGRGQIAIFGTASTSSSAYGSAKIYAYYGTKGFMFSYDRANVTITRQSSTYIFPTPVSIRCIKL
ncbi:MAG: hypothetical protein ACRCSB_02460, partial [Bacteroidales bacterium]